jgi:DNA primase
VALIKQESIDKVLSTARLEDVIGDFVNLKRAGSDYKGLCPFHQEKTPSFHVSPGKGVYKCFGCGKGGNNASRFLMDLEQMTFPESIRWLARRYNIELEETAVSQEVIQERQERESLFLLNTFAAEYYQKQLFETEYGRNIGLSYFKGRGYREETIRAFGLGIAPNTRDAFSQDALAKGYAREHLRELGLLTEKGFDFFRNRVMFPIYNLSGKVVGLAGRILQKDAKAPKYINSKENLIYNKRKELYGLWQARQSIQKRDRTILVEGYTDVISLHQAGITNVVAASGTSLTEDQVRLMKRFSPNITLLFDGDPAGLKAAVRGLGIVLKEDMNVKMVVLPDGEDPDSFLQNQGAARLEEHLEKEAKDFIHFKMELLSEEAGEDPVKKAELVREIVETIALIPDPIKRSFYIKDCSRILEISEEILNLEINKKVAAELRKQGRRRENTSGTESGRPSHRSDGPADPAPKPTAPHQPAEFQERDVARILVLFGDKVYNAEREELVSDHLLEDMKEVIDAFDHPLYKRMVELGLERKEAGQAINRALFESQSEEIQQFVVEVLTSPYAYSENWEKRWDIRLQTQKMPEENFVQDVESAFNRFKLKKFERTLKENDRLIKEYYEKEDDRYLVHLKVQRILNERRNAIAEKLGVIVLK